MSRPGLLVQLLAVGFAFTLGYVLTMMLWGLNIINTTPKSLQNRFTRGLAVIGVDTSDHEQVEWKLFGENLLPDEELNSIQQSYQSNDLSLLQTRNIVQRHTGSRALLESIPKGFQEQLHASIPLSCHSEEDGLISSKYQRFLRTLIDYSSFHKTLRESGARTLVWQCTLLDHCGGLADRMKGITYALLLAMFSRRRLILYWGGPEHTHLRPNMIDWTDDLIYNYIGQYEAFTDEYDVEFDKKRPNIEQADDNTMQYEFHMFSILSTSGVDVSEDELRFNLEVIGGRAKTVILSTNLEPHVLLSYSPKYHKWVEDGLRWTGLVSLSPRDLDNVVGIVFRYLFQMDPGLILEVDRARNVLGLDIGSLYLGVHIRTGFAGSPHSSEYDSHPKLMHRETAWQDVLNCAVSKADALLGNNSLVFLATDSVLVKHMAVSKHGARIRTLDNTLIHLDKMRKQPGSQLQNETEGVLTSWVDFLLLAEAYSQVRGNSGFPWAAGLLCSIPNERVIDGDTCLPQPQSRS